MIWKSKLILILPFVVILFFLSCNQKQVFYPDILFPISNDQSFSHTSISYCNFINTPAFYKITSVGVLFTNMISASPVCSPSRAAILTGKNPWQIEEAGTHASSFPTKFESRKKEST